MTTAACTSDNPATEVVDDWNLPLDFELYATFVKHKVYYSETDYFVIECVESLTPIDMTSLSSGVHDATGLCAWRGAFLLVSMMEEVKKYILGDRIVLELGAGTGLTGIALLKAGVAASLCFTDADPNANELCRRNCVANAIPSSQYRVEELRWGEPLPPTIPAQGFDAVTAADVIYDIGLLPILLRSAADCLRVGGSLILSHVPRACYNTDHPPVESLEDLIVRRAAEVGLLLQTIHRPSPETETWTAPTDSLNHMVAGSFQDMSEVDASVLVFRKA